MLQLKKRNILLLKIFYSLCVCGIFISLENTKGLISINVCETTVCNYVNFANLFVVVYRVSHKYGVWMHLVKS